MNSHGVATYNASSDTSAPKLARRFAVLSAGADGLLIGDYVHLATGVAVFGSSGPVVIEDFAGLSARVTVYTGNDDYKDGFWLPP